MGAIRYWVGLGVFVGWTAALCGAEIQSVTVEGKTQAKINLSFNEAPQKMPKVSISENVVSFRFPNSTLATRHGSKLDLDSPHYLIQRFTLLRARGNSVIGNLVLNGSLKSLEDRIHVRSIRSGFQLTVEPVGLTSTTRNFIEQETLPFGRKTKDRKEFASSSSMTRWVVALLVVFLGIGLTFILFRFVGKKTMPSGTRKFLIEKLGYTSLGPKIGVSLLKVGTEFFLVGVTPNGVNFLSSLPQLQKKYEKESEFVNKNFHDAVEQEYQRMQKKRAA